MLINFSKKRHEKLQVVSIMFYVYRFNYLEEFLKKLMEISEEGNNYLPSLLQDESNEYPTKISLDSEIQVEEFLPLLFKTFVFNEILNKLNCNLINVALNSFTFGNFTRLYINLRKNNSKDRNLLEKLKAIIVNILLADESKQHFLFSGFHQNILLYHPDGETFQLHQLILDNLKERCRKYGDTSTWGYQHNYGQGSASENWKYPQHNQYFSAQQQQNYGCHTDYGNQQISSHQQGFGDYTGSGHQQYTGHLEGNMGIQGGSGYHGEEDMDTKDEGENLMTEIVNVGRRI
uniref:Uncharacterized protein n=1 Tax=Meloidogyne enterolobii TaxID=390850 RepID=A0A6V7UMC9_MELEN|nr:unnamed protein product [Meloidogyne enterolobii]